MRVGAAIVVVMVGMVAGCSKPDANHFNLVCTGTTILANRATKAASLVYHVDLLERTFSVGQTQIVRPIYEVHDDSIVFSLPDDQDGIADMVVRTDGKWLYIEKRHGVVYTTKGICKRRRYTPVLKTKF